MMKWWVYIDGDVLEKPYNKRELNKLDEFGPEVPVMNVNRDEWVPAKEDPLLRKEFDNLSPLDVETETSGSNGEQVEEEQQRWFLQSDGANPDGPYTRQELLDEIHLEPVTKVKREDSNRWIKAIKDLKLKSHISVEPTYDDDNFLVWFKSIPEVLQDVFLSPGKFFEGIHPTSPVLFSWFFGAIVVGFVSLLYNMNLNILGVSSFSHLISTVGYYLALSPFFVMTAAIPAAIGILLHSAIFDFYAKFFFWLFDWEKKPFQATTKVVSYTHGATAAVFGLVATFLILFLDLAQFVAPSLGELFLVSGSIGFSVMFYVLLLVGVFWTLWLTYVGFRKVHELSEGQALAVVIVPPIISLGFGLIIHTYILSGLVY